MVYSPYVFATPLANGVKSFGMWVPNTDPSGSGLIANTRYRGQEGAAENARQHSHLGVLGVTGFLMRDLTANPLDYVEGGPLNKRRVELSAILDSTNPDLSAFQKRGGKLIVVIGTNDTLASPGAQLDYYQSVLDKMGRATVDSFARFFVLPQTDHGSERQNVRPWMATAKKSRSSRFRARTTALGLICGLGGERQGAREIASRSRRANAACRCAPIRNTRSMSSGPAGTASSYACAAK